MVSILVLMEVPLQPILSFIHVIVVTYRFNPCFNGSSSSTRWWEVWIMTELSFNPCFNGSSSSTKKIWTCMNGPDIVSILVLMEVPLQRKTISMVEYAYRCFNPCFNGSSSSTKLYYCSRGLKRAFQSLF